MPWKETNPFPHFVGACAFETHMDISQGNFYAKNAAKKPKARWSTLLDLTAAFNTYGKKPFSVDTRKKTQIWATPNFSKFSNKFNCLAPVSIEAQVKREIHWERPQWQSKDSVLQNWHIFFCLFVFARHFLTIIDDFLTMIFDLWFLIYDHVMFSILGWVWFINWIFFSQIGSGSSRLLCWPRVHSVRRDVDHYKVIWFCSATSS